MITKEILGKRVREVRSRCNMTLKDVETRSGLSSTHISEIERGMTSPTIGALIRIAHALSKDPSYFIEERKLEEICITTESDRPREMIPTGIRLSQGEIAALTRGVVCGRLRSYELRLEGGGIADLDCFPPGLDACFYCVEGKVSIALGNRQMEMAAGDSMHGLLPSSPILTADRETGCRLVVIADPREGC